MLKSLISEKVESIRKSFNLSKRKFDQVFERSQKINKSKNFDCKSSFSPEKYCRPAVQ